jgi:hypothetical protein
VREKCNSFRREAGIRFARKALRHINSATSSSFFDAKERRQGAATQQSSFGRSLHDVFTA